MNLRLLQHHYQTALKILRLPVATLQFARAIDPVEVVATYRYYTKPHPRYKLFRHKTLGAALIDLDEHGSRDNYLAAVKGKNLGAYHAKRARTRGYVCCEIDRNAHVDAIHHINNACPTRQGRPMDESYQAKQQAFEKLAHFRYYGILNREGALVAYANLGLYGNFAAFSRLIGIRNNDGIMHLLMVDIVCQLIDEGQVRYVMYDTYFGAHPGMRHFKNILGFRPYRAKYLLL